MIARRTSPEPERLDGQASPKTRMGRGKGKTSGLDVSKHRLDGHLLDSGRRLRVSNDPAGAAELAQILDGGTGRPVVKEASGGYRQVAHRALVTKGVPAAIVAPKRVRGFARARGITAKTDRIGAKVIAGFGASRMPAPTPAPDPARAGRAEILACRRQFLTQASVPNQQLEHPQSPTIRARAHQVVAFLQAEFMGPDERCLRRVRADAALAAGYPLLLTMPGCGKILAEMPELGRIDRCSVASLAGRAPTARDSGPKHIRRMIGRGRRVVRQVRCMDGSASRRVKDATFARRHAAQARRHGLDA
jgi:transposase